MRGPAIRSGCLKMKDVWVLGPKIAEFYSSEYFITCSFGFVPYQLCMSLNFLMDRRKWWCGYRPCKGGWVTYSECWAAVLPSHTFWFCFYSNICQEFNFVDLLVAQEINLDTVLFESEYSATLLHSVWVNRFPQNSPVNLLLNGFLHIDTEK